MNERPLICGFLKVRNEVIRESNIYRCVENMMQFCNVMIVADDASSDGSREFLQSVIEPENLILVKPEDQSFYNELAVKQRMLERVHEIKPYFCWWQDSDESTENIDALLELCEREKDNPGGPAAWRSHYTQIWRRTLWARTDSGFDDGMYIKLWRWSPDLSFDVQTRLHAAQFPQQLIPKINSLPTLKSETLHLGNYGKNLIWKNVAYYDNPLSIDRHMHFEKATYRWTGDPELVLSVNLPPTPAPFTEKEKKIILGWNGLRKTKGLFTVIVPTYNRAAFLPEALQSLLNQTYENWIAIVLDDGSTDNTPELMAEWQDKDPRFFYCRYPEHKGAVWMNERGMDMACEFGEFWTRLGSDDYFEPQKLALDAEKLAAAEACYGPYRVLRDGKLAELCNPEMSSAHIASLLKDGRFVCSWANIAARCEVLRKVKARWGSYVDPRLENCEDFLANYRISRSANFEFRSAGEGTHDSIWRINPVGASADTTQTGKEEALTRKIIEEENGRQGS